MNNLFILNDPDVDHTWTLGDMKSRPDLTLGDTAICDRVTSWSLDSKHFSFSDHKQIQFVLDYKPQLRKSMKFKTKNKSFEKFNGLLHHHEYDLLNNLCIYIIQTGREVK